MIRIAAVDDNTLFLQSFRDIIASQIDKNQYSYELDLYDDSEQFLDIQLQNPYDLVFLDMDMPKLDGIAIAEKLSVQNSNTTIIIVTEHEHFARIGYRYHVFRFVRKEYLEEEIQDPINSFLQEKSNIEPTITFIVENGTTRTFKPNNIVYLFSIGHYISIKLFGEVESINLILGKYTMNQLEEKLEPYGFLRIHKSYLINFRYTTKIQRDQLIVMEDHEKLQTLPISHKKNSEMKQKIDLLFRKGDKL